MSQQGKHETLCLNSDYSTILSMHFPSVSLKGPNLVCVYKATRIGMAGYPFLVILLHPLVLYKNKVTESISCETASAFSLL